MNYKISPVILYDEDEKLFYTKVGVQGRNMPLHYTVWGMTEEECRTRAERLVEILSK